MRTDVKLGVAVSMFVVLVTGGYFLFRGEPEKPVSLADRPTAGKDAKAQPSAVESLPSADGRRRTADRRPSNGEATPAAKPANRRPPTAPSVARRTSRPSGDGQPPAATPTATGTADAKPEVRREATSLPVTPPSSDSLARRPADSPSGLPTARPEQPLASADRGAGAGGAESSPTTGEGKESRPIPLAATGLKPPPADGPPTGGDVSTEGGRQPAAAAGSPVPSSGASALPEMSGPRAAIDTHRVQAGDSFMSLSKAYYGNEKYAPFLMSANPEVEDPARLRIGTVLKIPPLPADIDSGLAGGAAEGPGEAASKKSGGDTSAGGPPRRTYRVLPGDSFYRIARDQLGDASRWRELLTLNEKLVNGDPKNLKPGQEILLPN